MLMTASVMEIQSTVYGSDH